MAIKRTTRSKPRVLSRYRASHKWRDDGTRDCTHEITLGGDAPTVTMTCPDCHKDKAEFLKISTRDVDGLV